MLKNKVFELRDDSTYIPLICIEMNSLDPITRNLLEWCEYPLDENCEYILAYLGDMKTAKSFPLEWDNKLLELAHRYIQENFEELENGAIINFELLNKENKSK